MKCEVCGDLTGSLAAGAEAYVTFPWSPIALYKEPLGDCVWGRGLSSGLWDQDINAEAPVLFFSHLTCHISVHSR